jgi:hypothetical protein
MSIVNYPGLSAVTIPTPLSYGVVYYIAANWDDGEFFFLSFHSGFFFN